jgi:hypothetical protein
MKIQLDLLKNVGKFKNSCVVFSGMLVWSVTSKELVRVEARKWTGTNFNEIFSQLSQQKSVQGYDKK